ncbi:MAG: GAF domain-containing protein [Albidovulum sp.]|nr:GAF domain-containing protein [Albidovulum sp.]
MTESFQDFVSAIEEAEGQPGAACAALEKLAKNAVGAKLFTLMTVESATLSGRRIYSNMPEAYPVSGRKRLPAGRWTSEVVGKRRIFVANNIAAIAGVFPDHELIRSLGCESIMNIPVAVAGNVIGTINCLDVAGSYTGERVDAACSLALPGIACFLMASAFFENAP